MSQLPTLFNYAYQQAANIFGQQFAVYRPPQGLTIDQTPTLVNWGVPLSVRMGGGRFAVPNFGGVQYFTITGDRSSFLPGDVLVPLASGTTQIPTITVLNYSDNFPAVGFRTSRVGYISYTIDAGNLIYTNVYFDWLTMPTIPGAGDTDLLSGALGVPTKRLALWTRPNIQEQNNTTSSGAIQGMRILPTDGLVPNRYTIKAVTNIGNLTIFTVDEELN
jgi:hypothetical protein